MTPGEEVTVSDGQGMDYFCRIAELTKEEVRLDIVDSWHSFVELPAKIIFSRDCRKQTRWN